MTATEYSFCHQYFLFALYPLRTNFTLHLFSAASTSTTTSNSVSTLIPSCRLVLPRNPFSLFLLLLLLRLLIFPLLPHYLPLSLLPTPPSSLPFNPPSPFYPLHFLQHHAFLSPLPSSPSEPLRLPSYFPKLLRRYT